VSIAAQIVKFSQESTHVDAGGIRWYLRRFNSIDVARNGATGLLAAIPGEDPTTDRSRQASDGQAQLYALRLVCSAVVGASAADGVREPLQLVMRPELQDPDAGVVCVGSVPFAVVSAIAAAVVAQLQEDGADLSRFLGGDVVPGASDGEGVPHRSPDDPGGVDPAADPGGDAGARGA